MLYGVGTDIVQVRRMEQNMARYGARFARRILTDEELRELGNAVRPAHFLARRFAAKEAAAKAMGTGLRGNVGLKRIGVAHDAFGKPILRYDDRLLAYLRDQGVGESYVSIADEREYAVAFVVLVRGGPSVSRSADRAAPAGSG